MALLSHHQHSSQVFLAFLLFLVFKGVSGATYTIVNRCNYTVWPGIRGKSADLGSTGFELASGSSRSFQSPTRWVGSIWARTNCKYDDSEHGTCATGDCGSGEVNCNGASARPPATLAEFGIGSGIAEFYDVSLVDGFNLPVMVEAISGSGSCATTGCWTDLNRSCPSELRVDGGNACNSACAALQKPEYCCTESFNTPSTCKPTNYSQFFKSACPKAYSYPYDDATSTFTCAAGANYTITFCPSSSPSQESPLHVSPKANATNATNSSSVSGSDSSIDQAALDSTILWLANLTSGASSRSQLFADSKSLIFVAVTLILSLQVVWF